MTVRDFFHLPPAGVFRTFEDVSIYTRRMRDALIGVRRGKIECVTELTLTAGAASTVLTDQRLTVQSVLIFDPKTANAAAELAAGTIYTLTADRLTGAWTITHANNGQVDREYQVAILG